MYVKQRMYWNISNRFYGLMFDDFHNRITRLIKNAVEYLIWSIWDVRSFIEMYRWKWEELVKCYLGGPSDHNNTMDWLTFRLLIYLSEYISHRKWSLSIIYLSIFVIIFIRYISDSKVSLLRDKSKDQEIFTIKNL